MKRTVFISIFTLLMLVDCLSLSGAEESIISMSRQDVLSTASLNNLDIKLAELDAEYRRLDYEISKSVFDTLFEGAVNYNDDQLERTTVILGTRDLTANYDVGLSKKLPTGTKLELDFTNQRDYSNSAFATVNSAHTSALGVSIRQPVGKNFFGLADRGNIRIVRLNVYQSDLDSLSRIEGSLAQTEMDYWQVVFYSSVVELKIRLLDQAQQLYELYKDRFERGIAEEVDLYAHEANVNIRKIELAEARTDLLDAVNRLKLDLDLNGLYHIVPEDELELEPEKTLYLKELKEAISYRRDYEAAQKNIEAMDVNVVIKKNSLWPEIDLVASYTRNGIDTDGADAIEDIIDENNREYYLGIDVSMPLENTAARAEYKQAKIGKRRALIYLKKLELSIATEINERVRKLNSSADKIKKWQEIVKLQRAKLAEQEEMIRYGRSSSDLLIRYQDDVAAAELNLANAYLQYHLSSVRLLQAKNTLLNELMSEDILKISN